MTRDDKVLSCLDRSGLGLEIGPSHRPIAPKARGFRVEILDHLDQAGLRAKYTPHGVDLDAIEPVDHVWSGQSYAELTGRPHGYRWVIASHLIEHTPDLIGFVQSCEGVLDEDGVLVLIVPDKRYCFDHLRQNSSLAQIIDAHEAGRTIHSPGTAADYFLNVVSKGGEIAWSRRSWGKLAYVHGLPDAKAGMEAIRTQKAYLDLHAWCFTPSHFRLLMSDLALLDYTALRETRFFDTETHEFIVAFSRSGTGPQLDRMSLATRSLSE